MWSVVPSGSQRRSAAQKTQTPQSGLCLTVLLSLCDSWLFRGRTEGYTGQPQQACEGSCLVPFESSALVHLSWPATLTSRVFGPIQLREPMPRQVGKKSRGPRGERGLGFSRRRKGQKFSLYIPQSESHKTFFSLSPELMMTQQTTQFTLCSKDYITTMYPAWGQFLLPFLILIS